LVDLPDVGIIGRWNGCSGCLCALSKLDDLGLEQTGLLTVEHQPFPAGVPSERARILLQGWSSREGSSPVKRAGVGASWAGAPESRTLAAFKQAPSRRAVRLRDCEGRLCRALWVIGELKLLGDTSRF